MKKKADIRFSDEHIKYLKMLKLKRSFTLIAQFGLLVGILIIWELMTALKIVDSFFISSPSKIFLTAVELFGSNDIFMHMGITLLECILGFVISTMLGAIIAVLLWWSEYARKIIEPYLVILNSIPKIALGPVIIIWIGLGMKAIVAMAVLTCIIITITTILGGMLSCDSDKILLMKSMGASKYQILCKLLLPYSIPNFISVLKINIGLSWIGTIMGEYLASRAGLGYLIVYGGQVFKLDLVMTSVVLLSIMAAGMYFLIRLIEKKVNKIH